MDPDQNVRAGFFPPAQKLTMRSKELSNEDADSLDLFRKMIDYMLLKQVGSDDAAAQLLDEH